MNNGKTYRKEFRETDRRKIEITVTPREWLYLMAARGQKNDEPFIVVNKAINQLLSEGELNTGALNNMFFHDYEPLEREWRKKEGYTEEQADEILAKELKQVIRRTYRLVASTISCGYTKTDFVSLFGTIHLPKKFPYNDSTSDEGCYHTKDEQFRAVCELYGKLLSKYNDLDEKYSKLLLKVGMKKKKIYNK